MFSLKLKQNETLYVKNPSNKLIYYIISQIKKKNCNKTLIFCFTFVIFQYTILNDDNRKGKPVEKLRRKTIGPSSYEMVASYRRAI